MVKRWHFRHKIVHKDGQDWLAVREDGRPDGEWVYDESRPRHPMIENWLGPEIQDDEDARDDDEGNLDAEGEPFESFVRQGPIMPMGLYRTTVPETIPWCVDGIAYFGGVSLIAGAPKAGKSTMTADMVRAIETGSIWADAFRTQRAPVLLVTEEAGVSVIRKFGERAIDVLDIDAAAERGMGFKEVLGQARTWSVRKKGGLVLIDTLAVWADVKDENDAAEMTRAIRAIKEAFAGTGACVVLVHHARKGGGQAGEAIRGSSAIAATVDMMAELDYTDKGEKSDRRVLSTRGRVINPERYVFDFDRETGRYAVVPPEDVDEELSDDVRSLPLWQGSIETSEPGLSGDEVARLWKCAPRTVQRRAKDARIHTENVPKANGGSRTLYWRER